MGDAVDLYQMNGTMGACGDAVAHTVDDDLPRMPVEPVQIDIGGLRLGARVDSDAEPVGTHPGGPHPIGGAAQLEVERTATVMLHLRTATGCGGEQTMLFGVLVLFVDVDGGQRERDSDVPM